MRKLFAFLAAAGLTSLAPQAQQTSAPFDLVIRNGLLLDGTGSPARQADVGITGGRVAALGTLESAKETVDARGLVVAPGFSDVHTHADEIADHPRAEHFVRMGVTTVVAGNCGGSAENIAQALTTIEHTGISINYATLFGHNTVRRAVMGTERRPPTDTELTRMQELVAQAVRGGAVGFSTGLQYVPGTYADQAEIVALAKAAAAAGGLYATHMRNEGTELEAALQEALAVGEAAQCPVEISHLKVDAPSRWGASERRSR